MRDNPDKLSHEDVLEKAKHFLEDHGLVIPTVWTVLEHPDAPIKSPFAIPFKLPNEPEKMRLAFFEVGSMLKQNSKKAPDWIYTALDINVWNKDHTRKEDCILVIKCFPNGDQEIMGCRYLKLGNSYVYQEPEWDNWVGKKIDFLKALYPDNIQAEEPPQQEAA